MRLPNVSKVRSRPTSRLSKPYRKGWLPSVLTDSRLSVSLLVLYKAVESQQVIVMFTWSRWYPSLS